MHKFQRFCSWCRQECNRWCLTWWRSSNSEHGTSHMNCHSAAHRRDRYVCEIGKKHRNANCSTGERVKWTCVLVHSRNIILSCDKYRFMSVIIRMVEAKKNQNNTNKERRKKNDQNKRRMIISYYEGIKPFQMNHIMPAVSVSLNACVIIQVCLNWLDCERPASVNKIIIYLVRWIRNDVTDRRKYRTNLIVNCYMYIIYIVCAHIHVCVLLYACIYSTE